MKKILTLLLLFVATIGFAQNSGITYQAVIYGPNGQQLPGANNQQYILANKTICLQFSIIDHTGTVEYQETIVTTTDKFGMVNLLIGTGTQVSGYASGFTGVLWNVNTKSLKVELDPSQNCQNFTQISNNPFTYVPFAYYSANPGNPGTPGPAGPQGTPGINGLNGVDGISAYQVWLNLGNTGTEADFIASLTGPAGANGIDGATGPQGPEGPIGLTGPQGPAGANGSNGIDGVVGAQGPQGPQGLQGEQGPIGLTGPQGPAGVNGVDGATGPQGPSGANGIDGQDGLSAYQIWLNTGNTGTEAQFLASLQGVQGIQGPQGIAGTNGVDGATGPQGPSGVNGTDGLSAYQVWLNLGNTGTEAQFIASLQGPQGPAGNGFTNGTIINQMLYWNGSSWVTLNPGIDGQVLSICNGNLGWITISGICGSTTGTIGSINCSSPTNVGTLSQGTAASGVSSTISYTGGNGGTHSGQTVTSTGVTGLTATVAAGTFATGNGTLNYTISGTPSSSGTASFALNIGGLACTLNITVTNNLVSQYPAGSVFCASGPTAIVDVTNPVTGKTWMDRNLGATLKATSSTDYYAYGDLYQWGRGNDGHQCRSSSTTSTKITDQLGHGDFVASGSSSSTNYDWRSPPNNNLWQGVNGTNNPCPSGYRLPTNAELDAERASWSSNNAAGAFASPLKLPKAGFRYLSDGSLGSVGLSGGYWSSTVHLAKARRLSLSTYSASMYTQMRASGFSVRCLKD